MYKRYKYLIFLFLLLGIQLSGQNNNIRFDNLGKDDGLSYSLVNDIKQDDQGYIWIGTEDGLNRYDGYEFKIFRPQSQENSIYQQAISILYKDIKGRIWIRYNRDGLSYYESKTEYFHTFLNNSKDSTSISSDLIDDDFIISDQLFHEDKDDRLWIGTDHGLNLFRSESNNFEQIIFEGLGDDFRQPSILSINSNKYGDLLIGTDKGLILYKYNRKEASLLLSNNNNNTRYITHIHVDKNDTVWVGTRQNGLIKLQLDSDGAVKEITNYIDEIKAVASKELTILKIFEDNIGNLWICGSDGLFLLRANDQEGSFQKIAPTVIGDNQVMNLMQDVHGYLWGASSHQNILWKIDPNTLNVDSYTHSKIDKNSLGPNIVKTIFMDNIGILWVGLEKGGLSKINLYRKEFRLLNNINPKTSKIPNNDVYSIYVDNDENLWIGTHDGLFRKDGKTGNQKVYLNEKSNFGINYNFSKNPSGKLVGTIEPGIDGSLWFGYFDYKMSHFQPATGIFQNFQHFPSQDSSFTMWSLRDICTTKDGSVYFGGTSQGLCKLLPDKEHFKFYTHNKNDSTSIPGDWIYVLHEGIDGTLWIGTMNGGLAKFDQKKGTFISYKHNAKDPYSLSNNTVKCILEQQLPQGNRFWVGTERGINLFDPKTEQFKTYTTEHGLPSNNIHGILEDDHSRLWISSNGGISCFDPITEQFTNYNKEDGLQGNEFNQGAYFKDKKGRLYFGGLNGVTVFHPDSLQGNPFKPKLTLTNFKVNNEDVKVNEALDGQIILEKAIGFTDKITLNPSQNIISFSFTAFHYAAPTKIKYRYKLEPFDTKWNEGRFINYTNIQPGNYKLQLECSGIDGNWGADSKIIELTILPPFWKTGWFKIVILLFVLMLVFGVVHFQTRNLAKQKDILTKQVAERTKELKLKSDQVIQTNLELEARQKEITDRNKKIAEQRDFLEIHNQELIQQKKDSIWMAEQLHESDQSKLNFFTNISHEFRTPLSLIIGPTKSLLDRSDFLDTKKVKESLHLIYRNEKRLLRLINQILEIRRVESGTLKLNMKQMDVVLFSRELLDLFQPLATKNQITVDFICSQDEILFWFDSDKLEKILFNLLSNAFKHTLVGGIVSLSIKKTAQASVSFCISNSGKQIPEKDLSQIFDRFFQSSKNQINKELSFGIGLSLVKNLVELHEGQVGVESSDIGTSFTVTLPVQHKTEKTSDEEKVQNFSFSKSMIVDVQETKKLEHKLENSKVEYGEDSPVVLIVEDNADMLYFLSDNLNQKYNILTATNGTIGLEVAFEYIPDLIICDVMMPEKDGLELTHTLKNDKRTCHIPILLLTAKVELPHRIEGLQSGADGYLTKPFDIEALHLRLSNMFETRQNLINNLGLSLPDIPDHVKVKKIDHGLLEQIIKIIETNIDDDSFSGDKLAYELGMSKGSLYRKLKGLSGMTVNIFIRTYRLKVAAKLLQQGNCNISEVAYAVGFDNPKYFSVCFKQLFSKTPREYMNFKVVSD